MPAGIPHVKENEYDEFKDSLADEFDALLDDQQDIRLKVAKAKINVCILCQWVVERFEHPWFPEISRKAHMIICCDPTTPRNQELLKNLPKEPINV